MKWKEILRFPSPAGVFFISSNCRTSSKAKTNKVSVPCRGLFYFIDKLCCYDTLASFKFPSPAGVFFISSGKGSRAGKIESSFRPLPGSFLFHRYYFLWILVYYAWVSVPCRGLFYFINKNN